MEEPTAVQAELRTIATSTHGRYLLRRPDREPTLLLVGFHGYRENATRHLAELERIPGADGWALLAVDALHAFYAGSTGEVLRGWMTRELREEAIADNVAYVRRILDQVRPEIGWHLPLAFLGFSQGASMAWRTALLAGHGGAPPPKVVALAGDIPPELAAHLGPFPEQVLLAHGDQDPWYTPEKLAADVQLLQTKGVHPEVLTFTGGHLWTDEFRQAAGAFLSPPTKA
ncbi:MAG: phospholipase [Thermoanaerobaculia bacterium]